MIEKTSGNIVIAWNGNKEKEEPEIISGNVEFVIILSLEFSHGKAMLIEASLACFVCQAKFPWSIFSFPCHSTLLTTTESHKWGLTMIEYAQTLPLPYRGINAIF